ncbi:MAG: hypothetical protein NTX59_11455 [Elusimicrobia bacterium]|nr:hypothetical protein [Elusimicrobiota bacterium]
MKFLIPLLLLGAGSFGMTSLMMNQLMGSVTKTAQTYQKSIDSPLAALEEIRGGDQDLSDGDDTAEVNPRQAALQKLVKGLGKNRGFGEFGGKKHGRRLLPKSKGFMSQAGESFRKNKNAVLPMIWWGVPLILMVLTLLGIVFFHYAFARLLCSCTFKFCTLTLTVLSLGVLAAAIAGKPGFIVAIPRDIWFAPVLFILGSATVIRIIDMNYPIWNEALKAFAFPILSSVVVMAWTYLKGS